ncbi:type I-E CRISPR-associated protein Cas5/CasD [Desulfuromonas acetoxidans]|uniref:CRISPR-associated protein, CT1976 n=1 Tax=Desulfuromonas acetoxidans (strain DSM 684 / 11070) TaxID=281689 RepID=Q1JX11_DESA6|nr:type I-E CRISPR-associated protein Cas5/CasD [Desulfuromonas acetoxidans]EAT14747.1 CRISPR-associated protein, CT1976 [Desulfuromonas acetoxidans DSM 684]MBF0646543.1 type I-E CRISPR-associated protein Cas5/CasD [Desulfuromonas acetoxidans]NVD26044.1 type I-E CRISPR-associated protein Cas5/CasD [Desulfuromonas acetoxidans]NVE18077.1 type I-E CRISPR-associated protein Cas5/CasD [Desulfuromonas acetoxidans]
MEDFLILKLQGPMQAWGEHSFEGTRSSGNFPTLSALLGLLGACLGIRRNEHGRLQQLADSVHFAVRKEVRHVKTAGSTCPLTVIKMTDYHTVQDARQNYSGLKSHETIQTWREYLQDAEFTVAIWVDAGATVSLADLERAIKKPIFTPYLGRRSCPLAQPLFSRKVSAQNPLQAFEQCEGAGGVVFTDADIDGLADRSIRLRDVPMINQPRQFASRTVYIYGGPHVSE